MQPTEVEKVKSRSVSGRGKEAPYDHPHVYLEIDPKIGHTQCLYCGKKFEL